MCTTMTEERFSAGIISKKQQQVGTVSSPAKRSKDARSGNKNSFSSRAQNKFPDLDKLTVFEELEGLG